MGNGREQTVAPGKAQRRRTRHYLEEQFAQRPFSYSEVFGGAAQGTGQRVWVLQSPGDMVLNPLVTRRRPHPWVASPSG